MRNQTVKISKRTANALAAERVSEQIDRIATRAIGKTYRGFGWIRTFTFAAEKTETGMKYEASIKFSKRQHRERANSGSVFAAQFANILRKLTSFARQLQWFIADEQTPEVKAVAASVETKQAAPVVHFNGGFSHIFGRDPQIRLVRAAIEAAVASEFTRRNHVVLFGPPGCGKTEILCAFEASLGTENVLRLDATATSKAGAEDLILSLDPCPRFIILEEAEKCHPNNLSVFLGVLDTRGEIIKTNARIGSVRKECKSLVLATVNDLAGFRGLLSGALASRFSHQIYCPRPDRTVLRMILAREIAATKGDPKWIEPAIDYCLNVEQTNDPRRVLAVLDGRDRLVTGEYQADLNAVREAQEGDSNV